ncbi:MAG: aldolase catalytic domain-containing protein [Lachnospiraceae bacterium]|nr:aldolase catalytic domain-containing protein [Lachnospiraceae bacterium]
MAIIEGVRIVDATIRDGGLVNDFYFKDEFVRAVYETNLDAGVDYMEFGYRADKKQFDPEKFGKWKFASDEDIRSIVGENRTKMKISVMCDVGRCDYRKDIHKKAESPVDLVRVATYIDTIPQAIEMIEYADAMGYETTCNIMAMSTCTDDQLTKALELLCKSPVMGVYIVDSYGAMYPKQIRHLTRLFRDKLSPAGKLVGVHTHNNQQCAFANTLEAKDMGARLLDATAYGMGRGAGNCHLEALLGYYNGKKYHVEPVLDLVQKYMLDLKEQGKRDGLEWGYNTSYLLTGLTNQHPRDAIGATKVKNYNFREQYRYHAYE